MDWFLWFSLTVHVTPSKPGKPKLKPDISDNVQGKPNLRQSAQMLVAGERQPERV